MKYLLIIFLFLFIQEPVKVKPEPKINVDSTFRSQNMKLDSIIATKNAEIKYNLKDTTHENTH